MHAMVLMAKKNGTRYERLGDTRKQAKNGGRDERMNEILAWHDSRFPQKKTWRMNI